MTVEAVKKAVPAKTVAVKKGAAKKSAKKAVPASPVATTKNWDHAIAKQSEAPN
jgi:hypothetical protein